MMKTRFRVFLLLLPVCLLPIPTAAQNMGQGITSDNGSLAMTQAVWAVAGRVKTIQGDPVRGATVTVTPLGPASPRTLSTNAGGEFRTDYQLRAETVDEFTTIFTVKMKGFQTAHAYVNYGRSGKAWWVPITLHELREDDPDLLSPADLVSGLAPKLRQLGPVDGLVAKSAKDYTRGVAEFLDQHGFDRAVPTLARVAEKNPTCIGCRTMLGLAELSWCDWNDAKDSFAVGVNANLHDSKLGRPEPLVAYGTWLSWQYEPDKAEPFFQEALKIAPQDALALQELGRSLLLLGQAEAANDALKKALAAGAGPEAQLLYTESWLRAGRLQEAAAEMNRYLNGRDVRTMPLRVRKVWVSLQDQLKVAANPANAKTKAAKSHEVVDLLRRPPADLMPGLEPAQSQEPLGAILDAVGANILDLTKNFPNTSSIEAVQQEKLNRKGKVGEKLNEKFRYLCLLSTKPLQPGFIESRADMTENGGMAKVLSEGFMLTNGFTSAALIFHPQYRTESTFRYLGQQMVNGRKTFVVAFAQIPPSSHLTGTFQYGDRSSTTFTQGLAWMDSATYQITRLYTELLQPIPDLRVEKESTDIDFSQVHFKQGNEAWWLPQSVTVTLDWNGKILRNRHEYSDFKLFNVDASEKIGNPKGTAESSPPAPESAVKQ
jgi:tetratricopeptide (TPR) repeat protein